MSSIDTAGLSKSCMHHFVCFSASFPQTETEIDAHMLLNFLLHCEMRCTLHVDVHREASTEQCREIPASGYAGTLPELPPVLPCCRFAAYYSFPAKKTVPELNDQSL